MTEANFVYVIRYGDYDHKIGFSNDPNARLNQLRPAGARQVVRQWFRPRGDARAIEEVAHLLVSHLRLRIEYNRERFKLSKKSACAAVHLAICLCDDDAGRYEPRPEVLSKMSAKTAGEKTAVVLQATPSPDLSQTVKIGYVAYGRPSEMKRAKAALVVAGVDPARIFQDNYAYHDDGWETAKRVPRAGDTIVLAFPKRISPSERTNLLERGVSVVRIEWG